MITWLQLAFGTWVVLLPGRLVARALGVAGIAESFVWSVTLVAAALAITFAVHGSLLLTLLLVLAAGAIAFPFSRRRDAGRGWNPLVALAGIGFGIALWSLEGIVRGDALFHLGRMRKLDDFGSLSLRAVDEFRDGGLHPGYAFPLWHGWLALVGKVTALDPTQVVLHESALLTPLAFVLAYELGREIFGSAAAGVATLLAQVAMIALAPGSGGAYRTLELPGTTARQLLVPAAVIVFFRFVRRPSRALAATLALAATALAFVHPTYALFLAIVLGGYTLARLIAVRELRINVLALIAYGLPMALVFLWLKPIVDETESRGAVAQGIRQYGSDLVVHSQTRYHLDAGVPSRTGAVAIAALVLAPLAALSARRRWASLVLGGTALVLALELWPLVFPHFSHLVSLSQSRRAAGFLPFAVAFAGGLAVLRRALGVVLLSAALAAGIALQLAWPGDFGLHLEHGGPAAAAWIALFGSLGGLAVAAWRARRFERPAALAALLFVLPVAVDGFAHWDPLGSHDSAALTPGLVRFLRESVPERAVVYADLQTSYRISAYAPVYVANGPPTHVADTKANDPYARAAALKRFLRTGDDAVLRRAGAEWLVLRRGEWRRGRGTLVYRDERFRAFRLQSPP
ncbi:MAG TPA: hypothetical protein VGK79_01725 [Gaiellaceae bacterium]